LSRFPRLGSSTPSTLRTAVAVAVSRIGGSSLFYYTRTDKTAASGLTRRSLPTVHDDLSLELRAAASEDTGLAD
jgi:hypothetical protein